MSDSLYLLADVGGTNTRVAMARGRRVLPETIRRYRNREYANLAPVLRQYRIDEGGTAPDGACVCVAGPVANGVGELTNLDWSIDTARLAEATGATRGAILNDLQAQGHALGYLEDSACESVVDGPEAPSGARLVIGIGTGFNAAPVHDTPSGRFVPPCEAGHANLPIRTEAELRLCTFVSNAHGFPAVEDVLSGRGLERVYRWLSHEASGTDEYLAAEIMARVDSDPRAKAAVQQFIRVMGTVAGNLALIHLPLGGVYLVGGVARAMAPHLHEMGFAEAFRDKGRFAGFMTNFPVSLVVDDFAALTGCAAYLAEQETG
ncbi:glucokinase [Jannaschia pagri]|uniref:Glucokinase n=2 Tax=Roseobacteraceae TaxID=2854170 RepID=A0ABQ4NNC8_9RHOB|nr:MULTISPECIES: glucokinase [unclassified Jannaschia]GIT92066.1 glucokinase [Jannaschia sp. AI_61]GIT95901.1 glucokinase [Jannaschia sp. AI_62]